MPYHSGFTLLHDIQKLGAEELDEILGTWNTISRARIGKAETSSG